MSNKVTVNEFTAARKRYIDRLPEDIRPFVEILESQIAGSEEQMDISDLRSNAESIIALNGVRTPSPIDISNVALAARLAKFCSGEIKLGE